MGTTTTTTTTITTAITTVLVASVVLVVLVGVFPATGHVALKYPPARSYDLDFLDNGRTPAPCGMPKGDIKTSLIQGSTVNVTWHLAYPHQGGFYLELLGPDEQHKAFLTNNGYFISKDTTAQNFELKLPSDLTCRDCTIRLIRQAVEWGPNYRFWSCADVDIVPRSQVKRDCNGHGRYFSNRCRCNKRFYGDECQYENECENDEDCSSRFGKCVDIEATTYPKKQCFCTRGYFGPKCSKSSHIRSETQVNFGVYTRRNLSDALTLYWRVLREEEELEVVLVNKGVSYSAIGWRPKDATKECRNFPRIDGPPPPRFVSKEPKPKTENRVKGEPEPSPEGEPEPSAEGEPEPSAEGEPEPSTEGEPEPSAEGEPEPSAEGEPEPSAEGKPKPTVAGEQGLTGRKTPNPTQGDDRVTLAFPEGFFFQPVPPAERMPKSKESGSLVEEPLSLAERLAKYSNRPKRSPQREENRPFASPLLKVAKPSTTKIVSEPQAVEEPEPEPTSEHESEKEKGLTSRTEREPTPKAEAEPEPEPISEGEPEPEPSAEGEPEPSAEGEPEPSAEGEPEPSAKIEPKPSAEGEPEPSAEGEPEPSAKAEPEPSAEGEPEPEPSAKGQSEPRHSTNSVKGANLYSPRGKTLHPMDCIDVVIGMARENYYRAFDYYTRDRSTPQVDEYWGGEDSLTAVFGWEKNGETTFLFRKSLKANHPSDHEIKDELMHVIWARGQEENMYVHYPKSGLEVGNPSIPNFYKPDELKYHGKRDQRGVTSINFFESQSNLAQAGKADQINWCGGQWKYPHSCSPEKDCEYFARWEFIEQTDEIQFTVSSKYSNLWTGIGFSDDFSMRNTDVVLGWMTPNGKYFMYDGWLRSYTPPVVDDRQGISNMSATQKDGITTLHFTRKRETNDEQDLSFTDSKCLYLVFPVRGGKVNFVNKRISKHQQTPTISSQRICIRSCSKFGGADGKPIVFTTTPRPAELVYTVEFKITNAGKNMVIPERGTNEYSILVNDILTKSEGVFQKIPGFVVLDVNDLEKSDANNLKVSTRVTLNKEMHEEKVGAVETPEEEKEATERVRSILDKSVQSGRMGGLHVDPSFLRVNYLQAAESKGVVSGSSSDQTELNTASSGLSFLDKHKYWFIGGAILALIVLALIQGIITVCRKKRSEQPPVSTKERLISNSRWKDYSRGATNYAYETYEAEGDSVSRAPHSLQRKSESSHKNGGANGSSANGHLNGNLPTPKEINGYDHTRSLQRPRNIPSSVISDPRTTYSLPRGSSATSSPPPYSTTMQDLTPDFYYLPSQRKYSGEVVRVYVDYNDPI